MDDPELQRVAELLARQKSGEIDEAEREELALYDDQPELLDQAQRQLPALLGQPGDAVDQAWLARVRDDEALVQANTSGRSRLERGVGIGLIGVGWLLSIVGTPVGPAMAVLGVVVVIASFLRVRRSGPRDPYDEIRR